MNVSTLCLLAALTAPTHPVDDWTTVYKPVEPLFLSARGQTPSYEEGPLWGPSPSDPAYTPPGGAGAPLGGGYLSPFGPPPTTYDPFLGQPAIVGGWGPAPYGYSFGANGPQPYRFGWTSRYDVGFLPKEDVDSGLGFGQFGVFEFNSEWQYTQPWDNNPGGWIYSLTPQYSLRAWDGPDTGAFAGIPGNVHRFGLDLELATPLNGPWSFQLGFNPAMASDFEHSLSGDGWNLDGRAVAFYQYSPELMLALGAAFWDRVNDRVIPYAGFVWLPNNRWEIRGMFPQSRISYFLGNVDNFAKWLYVSGEYHVEAYEVGLEPIGVRDQIELADWRILLGLRMDRGGLSMFIEGGVVFGREVEFKRYTVGDFDPDTGFIGRLGVRY